MPKLEGATENKVSIRLYYEDYGAGKTVVLIHGWTLSGWTWENQIPPLVGAGFQAIA